MKRGRAHKRRRPSGLDPLSWSLFTVLVVSLFFKRLIDIIGTVTSRDCDETPIAFIGPTSAFDGPMEWLTVIGLSATALLIAQAVNYILTQQTSLKFWGLWLVNLTLAGTIIWAFLITWAYFNPSAIAARPVFQFTARFAPDMPYIRPDPVGERDYQSEGDWIWDEAAQSWTNQPLGLIRRYEMVRFCNQPERRRAQLKLIYGERTQDGLLIDELDETYLKQPVKSYVLYDLEGNYLVTLGSPYIRTSTLTRQRDAAYEPDKAAMSPEEAERRYFEWIDSLYVPQPAPRPQPLSREQIDQIVAESWGDERPSWYADD